MIWISVAHKSPVVTSQRTPYVSITKINHLFGKLIVVYLNSHRKYITFEWLHSVDIKAGGTCSYHRGKSGIWIFVNNQLDVQFFFMYVYFYALHDSGSHVPIIRRINFINTTSGVCHSVQMTVWCAGFDETKHVEHKNKHTW